MEVGDIYDGSELGDIPVGSIVVPLDCDGKPELQYATTRIRGGWERHGCVDYWLCEGVNYLIVYIGKPDLTDPDSLAEMIEEVALFYRTDSVYKDIAEFVLEHFEPRS